VHASAAKGFRAVSEAWMDRAACVRARPTFGAAMGLDAARVVFEQLGAAPDLARVASLVRRATCGEPWVDDA
jgi:hypothetical protein